MKHGSGTTKSFWMDSMPERPKNRLPRISVVDVCVVGGGLAGMTSAYLLAKAGRKVILLEDGRIGSGETSRTTAHLTNAMDDRIFKLEKWHGDKNGQMIAQSHGAAIDKVEEIVRRERIDCDFRRVPGYLFVAEGRTLRELKREHKAAKRAGLPVEFLSRAPLKKFDTGPTIRFEDQGVFHPLRYLHGLADKIEERGGRIYEGVHVSSIEEGRPVRLTTAEGRVVRARDLVVATNSPITGFFAIHTKQSAYRTYVVAGRIPKGSVPEALYWDTGFPYHYIRTAQRKGATYLIVGAEDEKTGLHDDPEERLDTVEQWTRERFPTFRKAEFRWSGQVLEPLDGAAFIGKDPALGEHVWVITGDSGQGMTHTTLGAMIVSDLVMGIQNPWADVYDPSRKMVKKVGQWIKGATLRNAQFLQHLIPFKGDPMKIPVGQGRVIRRGAKHVAVYRAGPREFEAFSAACAHLGCPVSWNTLENSWDCKCHGSRYDPHGAVLSGPANRGLSPWNRPIARIRPVRTRRNPPKAKTARRRAERHLKGETRRKREPVLK